MQQFPMTFGGELVIFRSLRKDEPMMNAVYPFGMMSYLGIAQRGNDSIEVRSINPVVKLRRQNEHFALYLMNPSMWRVSSVGGESNTMN